jgi:hypothetical protein
MSSSGLGRYREALNALAARTGAPVSSLAVSFALLHEITAIVPFAGIFVTSRWLGFGETIAFRVHNYEGGSPAWLYMKRLLDDGDRWAERVGRRYGIWGFPKGPRPAEAPEGAHVGTNLLGDVANAVVAYGITKASFLDLLTDAVPDPVGYFRRSFHSESGYPCI